VLREIDKQRSYKKKIMALFIDLSEAYDRVNRSILFSHLINRSVLTNSELDMIKFLFTNSSNRIGKHSITPTNGVPQGGTTSPILFDIFIESLVKKLKAKGHFVKLFADDIVVIGDL
jgi:hypothetical protein